MIRYRLACAEGHEFDEWFSNSAEYDARAEANDLRCPDCGGQDVRKAIMAPSVGKTSAAAPAPAPSACPMAQMGACGGGACGGFPGGM